MQVILVLLPFFKTVCSSCWSWRRRRRRGRRRGGGGGGGGGKGGGGGGGGEVGGEAHKSYIGEKYTVARVLARMR